MADFVLSGINADPDAIILSDEGNSVTVQADAILGSANSDFSINGRQGSNSNVVVNGSIAGRDWAVIDFFDSRGNSIEIGAAGRVVGGDAMAIEVSFDASIVNAGEILNNRGFGIVAIDIDGSVVNTGSIFGEVGGIEFVNFASGELGTAVLENHGRIEAGHGTDDQVSGQSQNEAVFSSASVTKILNTGLISSTDWIASGLSIGGVLNPIDGTAEVTNSGTIRSTWRWGIDLSHLVGASTVANSGVLLGQLGGLIGSGGVDTVTNTGDITGLVSLGSGNDVFSGAAGSVFGAIDGGAGNDRLIGGLTSDTIRGGAGDDTMEGNGGTDALDGGAGIDTILYVANTTSVRVDLAAGTVSFPGTNWGAERVTAVENAEGGSGNDIVVGSSVGNRFFGNAGNDTFDGAGGTDTFNGGAGSDTVLYTANTTAVNVNLATGTASFPGPTWPSESFTFIENASTGSAADTLVGSSVANTLRGSGGADKLTGAGGADQLIGGFGQDTFIFTAVSDSTPSARDTIAAGDGAIAFENAGATTGDKINLSAIDADTTSGASGNQAFLWGTVKTKGHLWAVNSGTTTLIRGNTDGDTAIEIEIAIADAGVLAGKYVAIDFTL